MTRRLAVRPALPHPRTTQGTQINQLGAGLQIDGMHLPPQGVSAGGVEYVLGLDDQFLDPLHGADRVEPVGVGAYLGCEAL